MRLLPPGVRLPDAPRVQESERSRRMKMRMARAPIPALTPRSIAMPVARIPRIPGSTATAPPRRHPIRQVFGESQGVTVLVIIMLCLIVTLLVRPMVRSLLSYQRTAAMLTERRAEVAQLTTRHAELVKRRDYYRTPEFIAERAREYGLVRPGERAFVVRELVHPELMGRYARAQLANASYESTAQVVRGTRP